MKNKAFTSLAFLLISTVFCGCFYAGYKPVYEYDLDIEPVPGKGNICIAVMRNSSSSGIRIQTRTGFETERNAYHNWVIEPGALVSNALNRALCRDGVKPAIVLRGEIECFEADMTNRVFRFSGFYSENRSADKIRFDMTAPLRGSSPAAVVLSATECVRRLAARMNSYGKPAK
ncbi:MAG: hypothetical protein IKC65_09240 [Lentisphaeria bacterium]|nr:hypothetical protein [Lentisphaeria bacterium]